MGFINKLKNFFNKVINETERITSFIKNIAFIFSSIFIIYLIYLVIPFLPTLTQQIKLAGIESMEALGFKVSFYKALNTPERIKGKEEIEVSKISELVKVAAEIIDYKGTFWVYLGATMPMGNKENWSDKYFGIITVPEKDSIIEATTDVFKRLEKPMVKNGEWEMGEIQGLVKSGLKVKVIEVAEIPGTQNRSLWWAKVLSP